MSASPIPLLGFCAFSGTGKTTLLTRLIPLLRAQGLRPGVIKHAHHRFDVDQPGKDSYQLRAAGADQVLVASRHRMALMREFPQPAAEPQAEPQAEPHLADLIRHLDMDTLDLILVEGFKHEPIAKIELHRPALGHPFIHADDAQVIALASDAPVTPARDLPLLDLNDPTAILGFIQAWLGWATQSR